MAAKKKRRTRRMFDAAFKANAVKEALEAKAAGGEYKSVAQKLDVRDTLLTRWIASAAKKSAGKKRVMAPRGSDFWAKAVAKVDEVTAAGGTQTEVARELGVNLSALSWHVRKAKVAAGKANGKAEGGGTIVSLSRELAAATERVEAIKKKLRKLLGA